MIISDSIIHARASQVNRFARDHAIIPS